MKRLYLLFFISLFFTSCNQNRFGDVHLTDDNGNRIGGGSDPNEWMFTNQSCSLATDNVVFPAYPNPGIDEMFFSFSILSVSTLSYKIIDEDGTVINEDIDQAYAPGFNVFRINLEPMENEEIYRVEYELNQDGCMYLGYGDIRKQ